MTLTPALLVATHGRMVVVEVEVEKEVCWGGVLRISLLWKLVNEAENENPVKWTYHLHRYNILLVVFSERALHHHYSLATSGQQRILGVFEERRELLGKWFDKWTDSQRKRILQDFFSRCTVAQLRFVRDNACDQVPKEAVDFATLLPRIVSLYIFSFLDPRSLCRCAQVSWHWRSLVELDQLWMPKCLRLGWCINFSPTPFEQAVWKRHYIETVQQLHVTKPKSPSQEGFVIPDVKVIGSEGEKLTESCHRGVQQRGKETQRKDPPPWRDSDRHPTDTLRFNYLQNDDPIFQTRFLHTKKNSSTIMNQEIIKRKPLSDSMYKLRKVKSLMFLSPELNPGHQRQKRPDWATLRSQEYPITKETAKKLAQRPQWNAGIRPGPARQAVPRMSTKGLKASQRSQRSSPSVPLFEGQSWKSPPLEQGSEAH